MFCPPNGTYTYNRDVPSNENHETGEDAFSRAFRRLSGLPEIVLIKARTLPHPSTYDELMESAKRIRRN
ncbi:MAG TPA: hypothetical protein VJG66_02125 [Patescibacteria group bacterium]|nr:hypothetical protein [Patescibacteria group bacterium]